MVLKRGYENEYTQGQPCDSVVHVLELVNLNLEHTKCY